MSYAYVLIDKHSSMEKSKEELAYDFAMEAIERHIKEPNKFDPSKNPDLISFLKYYYVKRLVSNSKLSGRYKYENNFNKVSSKVDVAMASLFDDFDVVESIDVSSIVKQITSTISSDNELTILFKYKYYYDFKRADICKELSISTSEYDNSIKRLRRVVKKILLLNNYEKEKR